MESEEIKSFLNIKKLKYFFSSSVGSFDAIMNVIDKMNIL